MNFKVLIVILITLAASPSMGQAPLVGSSIGTPGALIQKEPTSLLARPGPPVSLASRVNQLEAEFREKIEEINKKTSRSSKDQNEKIAIIRVRERNLAQLLNQTRDEMGALKTTNIDQAKRIVQLEKKFAMLENTSPSLTRDNIIDKMKNGDSVNMVSPLSKASIPTNEVSRNTEKAKGMPTNCKDLQLLGHQLSGFYSVKTQLKHQTAKIETVYCDFQASSNLKGFETRIGVVDVKSSPVHFLVSIQQDFYGKPGEKIMFQKQVVNIGGGFDWGNQWFVASYPGTYFFSVSGSKGSDASKVEFVIRLNRNGEVEGVGQVLTSNVMGFSSFSCQVSIKLNANDKIDLKMITGKVILLYFTGWMLEEDLTI